MHAYLDLIVGLMTDGDAICFALALIFALMPIALVVSVVAVVHGEIALARMEKARKAKIAADLAAYRARKVTRTLESPAGWDAVEVTHTPLDADHERAEYLGLSTCQNPVWDSRWSAYSPCQVPSCTRLH